MAGESRKRQTNTDSKEKKKEPAGTGTGAPRGSSRGLKNAGAGSKKTGAGTRKAGNGKAARSCRKSEPEKENSFMGTEVAIIVSFAISVLLFLSNFGLCGMVGNALRDVLLGIFGSIGYVAPVLLFIGTCFYLSNRGNVKAAIKMAAVLVLLLALAGLAQMMFGGGFKEGQKLMEYYVQAAKSGSGGGLIGGGLVLVLCTAVGKVGTYLILLVVLIIAAVCITEKSLVNFVKQRSRNAYDYAREDMDRRRVIHEERKEEKKRLREEQCVRGVNFDAMNLDIPYEREIAPDVPEMPETGAADSWRESSDEEQEEIRGRRAPQGARGNWEWTENRESITAGEAEFPERENPLPFTTVEKPVNPADVFRGNIAMSPASETEQEKAREQEAEDELLKSFYVRQDTRTLEELALDGREPEENRAEEEFDSFVHREDLDAVSPSESCVFEEEEEEIDVLAAGREVDELAAGQKDDELAAIGPAGIFYDPAAELAAGPDSFYIPEEPKTVVTASGKVIETDTELVRKTIEKKREERKNLPDDELTVHEQIERKADLVVKKEYRFPSLSLLKKGVQKSGFSDKEYRETAIKLQQTLQNFGVGVTVTNISCGPSVTRYELHPEQGVKVSKIVSLTDDIKLNLAAADIRIEAPIPGKAAVGIEVPNKENNMVFLRDLLESEEFKKHPSSVAFAVGKDIAGQTVVADIGKMPHLLIAGATGSGKSVCINTLIMSVIYKARPEDVKLIMIDPKVVELSVYNGIPHLLIPVVTDPKKASGALNWAVAEMTDRYQKFAKYNVRDLKGYNEKIKGIEEIDDENKPEKMPQIIIIVDELADLMMVAPGEVEDSICRLAQLARAAGIHLVIATQRPSVNVITGLIKANIPSRIAFSVSSGVDSRTIIDMNGAEKLLGKGDMLFYPSGVQKPQRVQGAFVSDHEVSSVVEFLTEQGMTSDYSPEIESKIRSAAQAEASSGGGDRDSYFEQAGRFIIEKDKASIGMLQRMFKIGFNRAARIMDQLAEAGVVGDEEGTKPRKVLMTMEQFENIMQE